MVDLVLGIVAAVGASTLYSLGIALQAVDAKEAPARGVPAPGACALPARAHALAGRHRPVDPRLAAAGRRPAARSAGRRAAGARRPACSCCCSSRSACSASTPAATSTWRWARSSIGVIGAALSAPPRSATHTSEEADDHDRARRARRVAALLPYLLRAFGRSPAGADHDLRRLRLRLERGGDQAGLR